VEFIKVIDDNLAAVGGNTRGEAWKVGQASRALSRLSVIYPGWPEKITGRHAISRDHGSRQGFEPPAPYRSGIRLGRREALPSQASHELAHPPVIYPGQCNIAVEKVASGLLRESVRDLTALPQTKPAFPGLLSLDPVSRYGELFGTKSS